MPCGGGLYHNDQSQKVTQLQENYGQDWRDMPFSQQGLSTSPRFQSLATGCVKIPPWTLNITPLTRPPRSGHQKRWHEKGSENEWVLQRKYLLQPGGRWKFLLQYADPSVRLICQQCVCCHFNDDRRTLIPQHQTEVHMTKQTFVP